MRFESIQTRRWLHRSVNPNCLTTWCGYILSLYFHLKTKGFFRGLAFPLASYGIVNSVFFGVYGNTLCYIKGPDKRREATYTEMYLAGCSGGFFQLFVACPVDKVKVVLQSQIRSKEGNQTPFVPYHIILSPRLNVCGLKASGDWIILM